MFLGRKRRDDHQACGMNRPDMKKSDLQAQFFGLSPAQALLIYRREAA
jgi:hypothetical protein